MKIETAINSIYAPKGITSVIEGVLNGDYSVLNTQSGMDASMAMIEDKVTAYQKSLDECKSDWSYWAILGDLEYWKAIRNIYKAAQLVGADNLPDIPLPDLKGCVVMDAIGRIEDFGNSIYNEAKKLKAA